MAGNNIPPVASTPKPAEDMPSCKVFVSEPNLTEAGVVKSTFTKVEPDGSCTYRLSGSLNSVHGTSALCTKVKEFDKKADDIAAKYESRICAAMRQFYALRDKKPEGRDVSSCQFSRSVGDEDVYVSAMNADACNSLERAESLESERDDKILKIRQQQGDFIRKNLK